MMGIEGIERLVEPALTQLGLVLHGVELKREGKELVLRIVADRAQKKNATDGVTIDELVKANDEIGALLDLENPIDDRYRLTIESPGVERDLITWRHFSLAVGERVRIVTRGEDAGVVEGELCAADSNTKCIDVITNEGTITVDTANVKNARTVFVWEMGEKRKF
ncbi:MAG: hypothetical protein J6S69_07310 [Proteobacteria bacterium]|nr:hypothetical protein [Pseudomonadota bacterium]